LITRGNRRVPPCGGNPASLPALTASTKICPFPSCPPGHDQGNPSVSESNNTKIRNTPECRRSFPNDETFDLNQLFFEESNYTGGIIFQFSRFEEH